MTETRSYDLAEDVAKAAAEYAIKILQRAIEQHGQATWVLAGGTSPMLSYRYILSNNAEAIDWSLVTVLMGDERMVPFDNEDSNWGSIMSLFDKNILTAKVQRIPPLVLADAEHTASAYESAIHAAGVVRFDLVWIGVGEDGHTLSLFPGNVALTEPTDRWVVAVHHAPKPPSDRISLSLCVFEHVVELVIFAVGASKRDVLRQARLGGGLPVSVVAETAESHGAEVSWLYDADAREQ